MKSKILTALSQYLTKTATIIVTASLVLTSTIAPQTALALNKTAIISQDEVTYNSVTATHIQQYLNTTGSQLASYKIPVEYEVYYPVGKGQWDKVMVRQEWQSNLELETYYDKSVAELIADWASTDRSTRAPASPGKINPVILLATLDKESASITGSYRTDILSRNITMSWLMGYGFNGKMDSCIKSGDCDTNGDSVIDDTDRNYFRQRAIWYGGPGTQIVEGSSALKRWSTNPEALNTCAEGGWRRLSVNGECLQLENSITHALYRYTPNFSGNELFVSLYEKIKKVFPFPSNVPIDDTANDIGEYSLDSYDGSFSLAGYKSSNNQAWFNGKMIADVGKTNWELTFEPWPGKNMYSVDYRRANGSTINSKKFHINRRKTGDIDNDGSVDIKDLSVLSAYWGHTDPPNPMTNLNPRADTVVDILDLSLIAANFEK
jgi:hypothetical protein